MRQPSSPRYQLPGVRSTMAALLTAGGLALAIVPAPAWAASNEAHVDRQVLRAMQAGQSLHLNVGARRAFQVPPAALRGHGPKNSPRPPVSHRMAVDPYPGLCHPLR